MRIFLFVSGAFLLACAGGLGKGDDEPQDTSRPDETDADTDADADADTDADTDADSDTDTDADTDADSDTDTDADTDTTPDPDDVDDDGDGYTENEGDCDDTAARVNPGAEEVCGNPRDEDCSGAVDDSAACETADTGLATVWWEGQFETSNGAYVAGQFGLAYYGLATGSEICRAEGDLDLDGDAPAGCPDCAWSFDLSAIRSSTAVGAYCNSGDIDINNGDLDGYFDYSWGFAYTYAYDYGGRTLYFEDNVMLYIRGYDWFAFASNLPSYGIYQTTGDAEYVTMSRQITSGGSAIYYYYYP